MILNIVIENVDEEITLAYTPPAPPLTETQHRLVTLYQAYPRMRALYLNTLDGLRDAILPERFLWPDDSIRSCARFFAAICRHLSDAKTAVRFCIDVATSMVQRCSIVIDAVLRVWPEVRHLLLNYSSSAKSLNLPT